MVIVWDEAKNRSNRRKHGISFDTAAHVFQDPYGVSYIERIVDGEERWHTIGLVGGILIVLVIHTVKEQNGEEEIRIISARKANRFERSQYEAPF